jgi:hypothetical protein
MASPAWFAQSSGTAFSSSGAQTTKSFAWPAPGANKQQPAAAAALACAACGVSKAADEFSPNQLRKAAARRCKRCVNATTASPNSFGWPQPAGTKPPASQPTQAALSPFAFNSFQQQAQSAGTKPAATQPVWNSTQQLAKPQTTTPFNFQPQQPAPAVTSAPARTALSWQSQPAVPATATAPSQGFMWNAPSKAPAQQPTSTQSTSAFKFTPPAQPQPQPQQPAAQQPSGFTFLKPSGASPPTTAPTSPFKLGANPPTFPTFASNAAAATTSAAAAATSTSTSNSCPSKDTGPQPVHSGVSCDLCGVASITGPRYKCLCCPNFDACGACIANDPLGTKCSSSASASGGGCKHDVLVRVCETRWMGIGAEVLQNQSSWAHPGFSCSGCGVKTIVGRRYTCTVCDNAHFCERCDFCGVHAAAGLEPHPMLRVNPTAPLPTAAPAAAVPAVAPATPADAVAAAAAGGGDAGTALVAATCFCCGWPQHEAAARGHKKKGQAAVAF